MEAPIRRIASFGAAALAVGLAVAACAPVRSSADPFAEAGGGDRPRGDARPYRVRLEVVCEYCAITYSIAGRITSTTASSPIWRWTLDRYPRYPEAIRLTANGRVERVRIYVNAEVAASAERRLGDENVTLQVETVIPPPERPEPDSLGVEGPSEPGGSGASAREPGKRLLTRP